MPQQVTIGGQAISGWSYDAAARTLQVDTSARSVRDRLSIDSCS